MIRTFGIAGAAILAITVILTLWSISANAQLTLSSNVSGIKNATKGQEGQAIYPKVAITSPTKNSSLPVGVTLVTGNSSAREGGNAIKVVAVQVDKQPYATATPKVTGNWSYWSIKLNIPNNAPIGPHVIQARATDIEGIQSWAHLSVNFNGANATTSSIPASSKTTAAVPPPTNATAAVPPPTNATAAVPPPTNATAAVPPPTNATAAVPPPTNATAAVPPPTNAVDTSISRYWGGM
jgi:hypothetical protein